MSSNTAEEEVSHERKPKPRRAEREIYRPGALRQRKESANLQASKDEKIKDVVIPSPGQNNDLLNRTQPPRSSMVNSHVSSKCSKELSKSSTYCKKIKSQCASASKEQGVLQIKNVNLSPPTPKNRSSATLSNSEVETKPSTLPIDYKKAKKISPESIKSGSKVISEKIANDSLSFDAYAHSRSKFSDMNNKVKRPQKGQPLKKLSEKSPTEKIKVIYDEKSEQHPLKTSQTEKDKNIEKSRYINNTFASRSLSKVLKAQDSNRMDNMDQSNTKASKAKEKKEKVPIKLQSSKSNLLISNKGKAGGNKINDKNIKCVEMSPKRDDSLIYDKCLKRDSLKNIGVNEKDKNDSNDKSGDQNNFESPHNIKGKKLVPQLKLKDSSPVESKLPDSTHLSQITQAVVTLDLASSEDTNSENEDYVSDDNQKSINPMKYLDCYKSNSFYGSGYNARKLNEQQPLKNFPQSSNVAWADEKWSPTQRQRKKKGKKDSLMGESPGRRGIIEINNSSDYVDSSETVASGQRLLFNPDNPSKPVAVMPSARDLHPMRDSSHGSVNKDKVSEEAAVELGFNEHSTDHEGNCGLDPSIFYSIQKGELDINYFVNSNQLPQEFRRIMDIRIHLQGCYKQLLVSDIRLCQEKNVEGALWKSLYYIIIEKLREYINREPTLKERSLSTLMMIVEEGLVYLQSLLTDIQKAYRFTLDAHFEDDLTALPGTKNRVRQALYSCQKLLLSLGDLARYKEQYNPSPNYSQAKKWYEMALQVNPKNGRPFNQLAILAVSQKRSLDVVYYYIRSLTASNPFNSARDSLISMFDDIRRKYESMTASSTSGSDLKNQTSQLEEQHSIRRNCGSSLRQEIWIRPDSGATNKRTLSQSDPDEEKKARIEEILRVPQDQLMKQFLTSFLHCHGMLFSRVGLDHFNRVLGETMNLFQALLQLTPPKLSPTHLLQIMAINMFAVDNTQLRDARLERGYRSAAQDLALLLSQEMFARLAEVMVKLFPACLNYTPKDLSGGGGSGSCSHKGEVELSSPGVGAVDCQRLFMPPLTHFIPAAKVWCDWLLYQSSVWNPPPLSHDITGVDTWGVIGELATIVKGIWPTDVDLNNEGTSSSHILVTLPEDAFLRGYAPIVNGQGNVLFCPMNQNKERAQDWVRVQKLQLCLCKFLCGVEPPVLRLQKTDQGEILVAVVTISPPDSPAISRSSIGNCEVDLEDPNSEAEGSNSDEEGDLGPGIAVEAFGVEDTPLASTVRLLARRKRILEKRQKHQRKMQAIMEGAVTLVMEVKPRYLVPDTNCFIEKLGIIKSLIESTNYTFMVPLIVLAELDGLSRDAAVEKYGDAAHAVNVREGASSGLLFVQSNKSPRLKCVTSQGSVAPADMFSHEMDTLKDVTNDDKILSCCLHLCSDRNKRKSIKEGVRRLHREVVLLTDDRNLRVKAYVSDVPVRELSDFAHWAGVK